MPDEKPRRAIEPAPRRLRRPPASRPRANSMAARAWQRRTREESEQSFTEVSDDLVGERTAPAATPPSRPGETAGTKGWRDLWHAFYTVTRTQVLVAVVLCVCAAAVTAQIRARSADTAFTGASRADLIQLLDAGDQQTRRLESELRGLEQTRSQLQTGADRNEVARKEAETRLDALSILAGTVPAEGPGIRITISVPSGQLPPDVLLDALEEMRDAGAEVIEINDSVRVVASTWVAGSPDGIVVDGQAVELPLVMEVIGAAQALEEGARFRGGLVSQVQNPKVAGAVSIVREETISIDSVHTPTAMRYARPS